MKKFIIFSQSVRGSRAGAERCAESAHEIGEGDDIWFVRSVEPKGLNKWSKRSGIQMRYRAWGKSRTDFNLMLTPASRLANGVTHYELYQEISRMREPVVILEHDAIFVAPLPTEVPDKTLVQVSSGTSTQLNPQSLLTSRRGQRAVTFEEGFDYDHSWQTRGGLIDHPLPGTNGTSGYIISPHTAAELSSYLRTSGVGFADRLRKDHIRESRLLLQNPQSVVCLHDIRSSDQRRNHSLRNMGDLSRIKFIAG